MGSEALSEPADKKTCGGVDLEAEDYTPRGLLTPEEKVALGILAAMLAAIFALALLLISGCASRPPARPIPQEKVVRLPPNPIDVLAARPDGRLLLANPRPLPSTEASNIPPVANISVLTGDQCCPPQPPGVSCPQPLAATVFGVVGWDYRFEPGFIVFHWVVTPGKVYEVQFTKSLTNPQWFTDQIHIAQGSGFYDQTARVAVLSCDSRFFRVTWGNQANVLHLDFNGTMPSCAVEGDVFRFNPNTWNYQEAPIPGYGSIAFKDDPQYASAAFFYLSNQLDYIEFQFLFKALELPTIRTVEVQDLYDITPQGFSGHEACNIYLHPDGRYSLYLGPDSIPAYTDVYTAGQVVEINGWYRATESGSEAEFSWGAGVGQKAHCFGSYTWPVYKFLWGPVQGSTFVYARPRFSTTPL